MDKSLIFFTFTTALLAVLIVFVVSIEIVTSPINQLSQAQSTAQLVKIWNFDKNTEDWKGSHTREVINRNGALRVRLGQTSFSPYIFNNQAIARLPLAVKYFTLNLAIVKGNTNANTAQKNIPSNNSKKNNSLPETAAFPVEPANTSVENQEQASPAASGENTVCTDDVRLCPDGTYVGRSAPDCAFLPCPMPPYPYFTFDLYIRKFGSPTWLGPIPITGKISSDFHEYTVKIPAINSLTIEGLRLDFKYGVGIDDVIYIDYVKLLNETPIIPTNTPTPTIIVKDCNEPCSGRFVQCAKGLKCIPLPQPAGNTGTESTESTSTAEAMPPYPYAFCRNPECPLNDSCDCQTTPSPTPTPVTPPPPSPTPCIKPPPCAFGEVYDQSGNRIYCTAPPGVNWCEVPTPTPFITCVPRPPCADGEITSDGRFVYCLPSSDVIWCPRPSPTSAPSPTPLPSAAPTCIPFPEACIDWVNGQAQNTCPSITGSIWCPLPTCIPRPACLDANPPCLMPETNDMCPKEITPTEVVPTEGVTTQPTAEPTLNPNSFFLHLFR